MYCLGPLSRHSVYYLCAADLHYIDECIGSEFRYFIQSE